jgi:hypothetical protein
MTKFVCAIIVCASAWGSVQNVVKIVEHVEEARK